MKQSIISRNLAMSAQGKTDIVEMAEREMKSTGKNKRAVPIFQKY